MFERQNLESVIQITLLKHLYNLKLIAETKLYKNEEQITYEILSFMTVFVATKNRIQQRSEVHFLIFFV